jgi:hypothetical protein
MSPATRPVHVPVMARLARLPVERCVCDADAVRLIGLANSVRAMSSVCLRACVCMYVCACVRVCVRFGSGVQRAVEGTLQGACLV